MARYVIIDPWGNPYRYRLGFQQAQYSVGAAVGMFKSAISCVLVGLSYILADKCAGYRIF